MYVTDTLQALFQRVFDETASEVLRLKGDGSARTIYRLRGATRVCVGVHGTAPAENRAFVGFTRHFRSHALNVPEIFAVDDSVGVYLEEDLGEVTLFDWLASEREKEHGSVTWKKEWTEMYRRVIAELPKFQIVAGADIDYSLCYQHDSFGRDSMLFDLHYFRDMFLGPLYGGRVNDEALERDFRSLVAHLLEEERRHFLYRDFQSRNIMISSDIPHFIDYQSGRRGALQYDIASLLNDARAEIPEDTRKELLESYLEEARKYTEIDPDRFLFYYDGFALIRSLQALGAFGNLGVRQGKRFFLESIPFGLRNMELLLAHGTVVRHAPYLVGVLQEMTGYRAFREPHSLLRE